MVHMFRGISCVRVRVRVRVCVYIYIIVVHVSSYSGMTEPKSDPVGRVTVTSGRRAFWVS